MRRVDAAHESWDARQSTISPVVNAFEWLCSDFSYNRKLRRFADDSVCSCQTLASIAGDRGSLSSAFRHAVVVACITRTAESRWVLRSQYERRTRHVYLPAWNV